METRKNKKTKPFQSYLLVTNNLDTERNLREILNTHNIEFTKSVDNIVIEPEKDSIRIGQIRTLKQTIYQKPILQKLKVVIIKSAEKLTVEAQNALLKIVEEPPSHAIIILISPSTKDFLPTILSRIVKIVPQDGRPIKQASDVPSLQLSDINQSDPSVYLDKKLEEYFSVMIKNLNNPQKRRDIQKIIGEILETKQMIGANVNAKFSLANLIFKFQNTHQ